MEENAYNPTYIPRRRPATTQATADAIHNFLKRQKEKEEHYKNYNKLGYTHTQVGKCNCCPLWRDEE